MNAAQVLILILLLVNSVVDLWLKRISLLSLGIYALVWTAVCLPDSNWQIILPALVPGVLLTLIGYFTKGSIGMGDGFLVFFMGLGISWTCILAVLMLAFLLAFCWAVAQWVLYRSGQKSFPFVPFILMGYVVVLIV